jgi:hypothetical protein
MSYVTESDEKVGLMTPMVLEHLPTHHIVGTIHGVNNENPRMLTKTASRIKQHGKKKKKQKEGTQDIGDEESHLPHILI